MSTVQKDLFRFSLGTWCGLKFSRHIFRHQEFLNQCGHYERNDGTDTAKK